MKREAFLGRLREALRTQQPAEPPGPLPRPAEPQEAELEALLMRRLAELGAEPARGMEAFLQGLKGPVYLPPWEELAPFRARLAAAGCGLTEEPGEAAWTLLAAGAAAVDTGTLVFSEAELVDPRPVLLPDALAVWVPQERLAPTLEEALTLAAPPTLLITGPSRTADIEKEVVLGAQGPRRLRVGWG